MERWYVLETIEGKEQRALELVEKRVAPELWSICCIPQKMKVFRSGGALHLVEDVMFPGYLLVKTEYPLKLGRILSRAKEFPQVISIENRAGISLAKEWIQPEAEADERFPLVPIAGPDLRFLQAVCGEELKCPMGISRIQVDNKRIIKAEGVLENYLDKVVKLNLHKRFAIAEIPLFQRKQLVLFGISLEQDKVKSAG